MKRSDSFELAARNLRESVLRNSLTTAGIAVGVASLVAMLSLGVGLQALASKRLTGSGLFNTVVVFPARDEFRTGERRQQPPPPEQRRAIDDALRAEFAHTAHVVEVYPDLRFAGELRTGDHARVATVRGLPPSSREVEAFEGMQGKFFSAADSEEVILRSAVAAQLSDKPESLIGREVTLRYAARQRLSNPEETDPAEAAAVGWGFAVVSRERKLRVIGIVEKEPLNMLGNNPGGAFISLGLAEKMHPARPGEFRDLVGTKPSDSETYSSLIVKVASPKDIDAVESAAKKMGLGAFSLLDATRSLRRFFAILDLFLGIFGSLALAVASLGIINTLVMAILERRREIGIMKAIGASDSDVRSLFFVEAGAMGVMGGALGVAFGWAIGRVINFGTNIYLDRQQLPHENIWTVPWWLVAGAIGFALVVSLVSGLYPAGRAARLDPVQALRYE